MKLYVLLMLLAVIGVFSDGADAQSNATTHPIQRQSVKIHKRTSATFGDGTKGGGGIKRIVNGVDTYLTFADVKIKLRQESLRSIPGIVPLENTILKTDLVDSDQSVFIQNIVPIGSRQY